MKILNITKKSNNSMIYISNDEFYYLIVNFLVDFDYY